MAGNIAGKSEHGWELHISTITNITKYILIDLYFLKNLESIKNATFTKI